MDLTMRLVERLKGVAVKMGTEGLRMVVDGTVAAVKVVDRLQELLPDNAWLSKLKRETTSWGATGPGTRPLWEKEPRLERPPLVRPARSRPVQPRVAKPPPEEVRETAQRVLAEVEAVQGRLKRATPAKRPLKVVAEPEEETPKRRRTSGRKTSPMATTSAKRVTAPKEGGFKAKRGQKHRH